MSKFSVKRSFIKLSKIYLLAAVLFFAVLLCGCALVGASSPVIGTIGGIKWPTTAASIDTIPSGDTTGTSGGGSTSAPPVETTGPSSTANTTAPEENERSGILICIDAGHGGHDSGATGTILGKQILEKDVNLTVASLLRDRLKALGYSVMMTRDDDTYVDLDDRRNSAVSAGAALFISIHCNAYSGSGRAWGTEVYYNPTTNYASAALAKTMCSAIDSTAVLFPTQRAQTRAKADVTYLGYTLRVLRASNMPSLLIELGYMSDSGDLALLVSSDWTIAMARAISDGVELLYLSGKIS